MRSGSCKTVLLLLEKKTTSRGVLAKFSMVAGVDGQQKRED